MDRIDSQSVVTDRGSQNPVMFCIFCVMVMVIVFTNSVIGPMSTVNIVSFIGTISFSCVVSSLMVSLVGRVNTSDTFRVRGPSRPQQQNGGNRPQQNQQQPRRDDRQQPQQQNQRRDNRQQGQSGNQPDRNGQTQTQPQS